MQEVCLEVQQMRPNHLFVASEFSPLASQSKAGGVSAWENSRRCFLLPSDGQFLIRLVFLHMLDFIMNIFQVFSPCVRHSLGTWSWTELSLQQNLDSGARGFTFQLHQSGGNLWFKWHFISYFSSRNADLDFTISSIQCQCLCSSVKCLISVLGGECWVCVCVRDKTCR